MTRERTPGQTSARPERPERPLSDRLGANREKIARALARLLWNDQQERRRRTDVRELDR